MKYHPDNHHRRSTRLNRYDYSQAGAYFVTICARERECLFGDIVDGEMRLNEYGTIVEAEWARSSEIRKEIEMDEFIVMPNHVHGIVMIKWHLPVGANGRSPLQMTPKSISSFMSGFKSSVTKIINEHRNTPALPVWQRNYYEHVIRNEEDLTRIRKYIVENPLKWGDDEDNPANIIHRDRSRGERPFAPTNNP